MELTDYFKYDKECDLEIEKLKKLAIISLTDVNLDKIIDWIELLKNELDKSIGECGGLKEKYIYLPSINKNI